MTTPLAPDPSHEPIASTFWLGRLSLEALPLHEPIVVATFVMVALGGLALLGVLTWFKLWGYLWREWFTSIDHKKIGIKIGRAHV